MWESILSILERLGAPAGWITAIVQLLIWIIGVPIFYVRYRRQVSKLEKRVKELGQTEEDLREELGKMKDLAYRQSQMVMAALSMMKIRAPKLYREYVGSFGGEKNFTDWWLVP